MSSVWSGGLRAGIHQKTISTRCNDYSVCDIQRRSDYDPDSNIRNNTHVGVLGKPLLKVSTSPNAIDLSCILYVFSRPFLSPPSLLFSHGLLLLILWKRSTGFHGAIEGGNARAARDIERQCQRGWIPSAKFTIVRGLAYTIERSRL